MPEQGALEQLPRQARTAHRHKWPVRPPAALVNETRQHVLARPALALEHDARIRARRLCRQPVKLVHALLRARHLRPGHARRQPPFPFLHAALLRAFLLHALQEFLKLPHRTGLGQVIEGAQLDRRHRRLQGRERRKYHHRPRGAPLPRLLQQLQPILPAQAHVQQHQVHRRRPVPFQKRRPGLRHLSRVAAMAHHRRHRTAEPDIVIDYENVHRRPE